MSDETTALQKANENGIQPPAQKPSGLISRDSSENALLMDTAKFEHCLRLAKLFSQSRLVPDHYRGNLEDCFIAIVQAIRMRTDVMGYMQNTYVIGGKLAMEGKLAIALINSRGPFAGPLQWEEGGEGKEQYAVAYATHEETGEVLRSIPITIQMAEDEGWTKNKKWKSMPAQMLRYRSAAFFGRAYCPDVIMGMLTKEEADDLVATGELRERDEQRDKAADLTARILGAEESIQDAPKQIDAAKGPEVSSEDFERARQEREEATQKVDAAQASPKPQKAAQAKQQAAPEPENDAGAQVVSDTIEQMRIEIEQCAECQTREQAVSCVQKTFSRYRDIGADWPAEDKKRMQKAYGESTDAISDAVKALPSETEGKKAAPTKAEAEVTKAETAVTNAPEPEPEPDDEGPPDEEPAVDDEFGTGQLFK